MIPLFFNKMKSGSARKVFEGGEKDSCEQFQVVENTLG